MVRHRRPASTRLLPLLLALAGVVLVGCSDDEPAATTTTTAPPTTTAPTTTVPPEGGDEPLPVAWVRQVGGTGDDVIRAVAGRDELVVGAGSTTGLPPAGDPAGRTPPASGLTAAFVDVVAAADGTPTATVQSPQERTASADAVASGGSRPVDGSTAPTTPGGRPTRTITMACGATPAATGRPSGDAPTGGDAWCAPVGSDGTIGTAQIVGSDADDAVAGVAVHDSDRTPSANDPAADAIYAVGRTSGLFPGAKDPTGGFIGEGDALVTRLDPSGSVRWARQFGTLAPDRADAVTTSDDGDAIVAGATAGRTDGDIAGEIGGTDAWIARMDPNGNLRWLTQFGSADEDAARAVARGGDPRRGTEVFVAAGRTSGAVGSASNLGGDDVLVSAFDASGRQLWTVQFGSTGADEATGVVVDGSTVYVTGTAAAEIVDARRIALTPAADDEDGTGPSDPSTTTTTEVPAGGGTDGFLAAIDVETGTLRWVAQFGSTGDEIVTGITRTETGLIVVAGSTTGQLATTPAGGGTDGFMVAFTPPAGGGGAASIV